MKSVNNPTMNGANVIDFRVRVPATLCPAIDRPEANSTQYDAVLDIGDKYTCAQTVEDLLGQMDSNGVDHAVVHAEHEYGDMADALNQAVARMVAEHPDRFTGIGTVSLEGFSMPKVLQQIDDCIALGMIGLSVEPAFFGMTLDDRRLYPVYAKAMENNLLVALHTGINYTTNQPMTGENPILLDQIACDFPGLTLVASHGGWPWINEMVAIARKHPQVFIEFGGIAPKYVASQGGGWEVMHRFMNSVLKGQILYGTDWPTMDHKRTLAEWREMGLKPEVLDRLLAENTRGLLKNSYDKI